MDILRRRLHNQRLIAPAPATAAEVVRWLGAVQAQDYGGARWAVAQRTRGLTSDAVDEALAQGTILRTHVLRPTWHLVTPADILWMLHLTAPRVKALMTYGNRQSGLDDATLATSNRVLAKALRGGRQLTRIELVAELRSAGIEPPDTIGLGRLMVSAELDGVVCSGALRGKQHTYALLEERAPFAASLERDAALVELARRYYASHGPATVKDFAWWSGLSVADATAAVTNARPLLHTAEIDGRTYWSTPDRQPAQGAAATSAQLLPNFDEYTVGYADRGLLIDQSDVPRLGSRTEVIANNVVVVDGRVVGTWKRSARVKALRVTLTLFRPLTDRESTAVAAAAERYGAFLGLPVELERQPAPPAPSGSPRVARSMTNR